MDPTVIRNNLLVIAILIFLGIFGAINVFQPSFLYNTDGSLRQWGIGRRLNTIFPVWLIGIMIAIFSYMATIGILMYSMRR